MLNYPHVYNYDENGVFINAMQLDVSDVNPINGKLIIPGNSTLVPVERMENHIPVFNKSNNEWEQVLIPVEPEPVEDINENIEDNKVSVINLRQAREVLIRHGLFNIVEEAINDIADPLEKQIVLNYWEYSTVFEINHPVVKDLAFKLGITDLELEELFTEADKL